jgi:hypothetical protein
MGRSTCAYPSRRFGVQEPVFEIELIEVLDARRFRLSRERYEDLRLELRAEDRPECNFLDPEWLRSGIHPSSTEDVLVPRYFWWHGKSTPRHLEIFSKVVLPAFEGRADIVVNIRNRTSYQQGFRLRKGKVTQHRVVTALGDAL